MKVTCYASGVIGSSWATAFALNNFEVWIYDLKEEFLDKALIQVKRNLEYLKDHDCLQNITVDECLKRIKCTTSAEEALRNAAFVQESGPENIEIKQEIVNIIDQYAPINCVVASSTSGLPITHITEKSIHPERYIGAHPFNPPHLIPLVEITKGKKTSEEYIAIAVKFYKEIKKEPIVLQKEKIGFVANRLSHAVLREVMSLVAEGVCTPEDADKALVYGPGIRWASIGQILVGELGSQGGNMEAVKKIKQLNESIFGDLENRTKIPENWGEISTQGAKNYMNNMPDEIGHTREDMIRFRDTVLVELLKLHKKI